MRSRPHIRNRSKIITCSKTWKSESLLFLRPSALRRVPTRTALDREGVITRSLSRPKRTKRFLEHGVATEGCAPRASPPAVCAAAAHAAIPRSESRRARGTRAAPRPALPIPVQGALRAGGGRRGEPPACTTREKANITNALPRRRYPSLALVRSG